MKKELVLRITSLFYIGTIMSAFVAVGMAFIGFDEAVSSLMFCTVLFLGLGISTLILWNAYY